MIEFFIIIVIFLGMIFKKSKLLTWIMLLIAIVLIGGSSFNADYYSYENNYFSIGNGLENWDFEFGFQLINKLAYKLGFSYQDFRIIIALIGMLLIYQTVKKFTQNTAYVMSLYLIYPLILDTIQIRNFFAMSIVIYGMRYIISLEKYYLKFIIAIALATSIHATMAFYLAFLLVSLKNNQKMISVVVSISVLSTILMPYIIKTASFFIASDKISTYFYTETSILTQIGVFIYFFYSIYIIVFLETILSKLDVKKMKYADTVEEKILSDSRNSEINDMLIIDKKTIVSINIIALLSLPLVINNLNFFRLYRNIFIINYIYYAVYFESDKKTYNSYFAQLLVLVLIVVSFILLIYLVPQSDIITPVFDYNVFF